MAKYTCYIEGDKSLYPVLLSNGNLVQNGDLEVKFAYGESRLFPLCYSWLFIS